MGFIIIICIIGIIAFLYSKVINNNAIKGNLSPVKVIYLNGCLGYENGVEVNIQANPNVISIDKKYDILIQKISNVKIIKTKKLIEEQKNVIGRAIVGTIIAGSTGGIIGGISGADTKTKTEEVEVLTIIYKDLNEVEQTISLSWKSIEEKSVVLNSWTSGLNDKIKYKKY